MCELPFASAADILGSERSLVLAPHADDESLGCGGLIADAARHGRAISLVFLTDGSRSHPGSRAFPPSRIAEMREREALEAARLLGVREMDDIEFLRLTDGQAPVSGAGFEQAVDRVLARVRRRDCGTILSPWRHDPHCDHLAAHKIAEAVARIGGLRHLSYPVWGWLLNPEAEIDGAICGRRLDIRTHLQAKTQAIDSYASQRGQIAFDIPCPFEIPPQLLSACTRTFEVFLES